MIKGLYVHIPFCLSICSYCDFVKLIASDSLKDEYVAALTKEISENAPMLGNLQTIYIGGGTPSCLNAKLLVAILEELNRLPRFFSVEEFTFEANPGDIDSEKAKLLASAGVTRISLGVQTFSPNLLKKMHRSGGYQNVAETVALLRQAGINDINFDMIYGYPGQDQKQVESDLEQLQTIRPNHVSYYSLMLEEKTELHHLLKKGLLDLPDDDDVYDMGMLVIETLKNLGYNRYEISNFCLPQHESKHNLLYWNLDEYLGVGMGAASQHSQKRFLNHGRIRSYIEAVRGSGVGIWKEETFEPEKETLMLGLRKSEGVDTESFRKRFNRSVFARFPKLSAHFQTGLLEMRGTMVKLTARGMDLMNQVLLSLD